MAIFDTEKTVNLTFYIVLNDAAAVAGYQAQYPNGVNRAPIYAAVEFGAPWIGLSAGIGITPPVSYTDWPSASDKPFPTDVAVFSRHTGGLFGIGGTTVRYFWIGKFVLGTPATGTPTGTPTPNNAPTPRRYWLQGFETPGSTPEAMSTDVSLFSTDASRHTGGRGFAIRGLTNAKITELHNQYDAAAVPTRLWERMYIRLRKNPSQTIVFWRNHTLPSASVGTNLAITADGGIAIYTANATAVLTLVTVVPGIALTPWTGRADDDAWHKLDLVYDAGPSPTPGTFKLYVDGVLVSSSGGVTANSFTSSDLGGPISVTGADLYLDVDDWSCSDWPVASGSPVFLDPLLGSKDFLYGTKITLVKPRAFATSHTGWTGDVRVLMQNAPGFTPADLTSSTSAAVAAVTTDSDVSVKGDPGSIGLAALLVACFSKRGGAGISGKVGYKVGAAAAVDTLVTQGTTNTGTAVLYSAQAGGLGVALPEATPIELRHVKGADAIAATVSMLHGQAELVGKWTRCDYSAAELEDLTDVPAIGGTGPHNTPYPTTPWARRGETPISPVMIVGGTYVGTGTGIDLNFRIAPHFLFIRPVTGNTGGFLWMAAAYGPHKAYGFGANPAVATAELDPTFVGASGEDAQQQRFRVRLAGNDTQLNAVGVTYQYMAFCDPGMRYLLAGSLSNRAAEIATAQPLISELFTPEWGFFLAEENSSDTTRKFYAKSPGQAAASIVAFQPGTVANAVTFGEGQITTDAAAHALGSALSYALMRRHDGSQDTTESSVVCFGNYTGDGSASRSINLSPATGKRPMFAFVFAESGTSGYHRDPSHTGSNSSTHTGTENTTGITSGGIDQINVGSTLNASGVLYSYWVLFGDATACNNGWGCNGEYPPVEPYPTPGPYPTPIPNPGPGPSPTPTPVPAPCPPEDPDCIASELSVECKAGTTAIINRALAKLGISKLIADASTATSVENAVGLLHYGSEVNNTLRDFPWPFATKWNLMVPLAGSASSAATDEWQYVYRLPGDCVFPRRICSSRGGALDPTPQPFEQGQQEIDTIDGVPTLLAEGPVAQMAQEDWSPGLIYTNQANAYLEYTARPRCAAASPDPLFREALAWRLAASMSVPLTRLADRQKQCMAEYARTLREAELVNRPGKPGLRAGTVDAQAATKLLVVNRALIRIGARQISHYLTDDSREAQAARAIFEEEYRSVLQDFPWAFATAYATPTVTGDGITMVNADWWYSVTLPADVVAVRRLVLSTQRGWDENPATFRLGPDGVLYTDLADPTVEYTALVDLDTTDALFRDALAWRLAASLAPSLASVDPDQPEQLGRAPDPDGHNDPRPGRGRTSGVRQSARQRIAEQAWAMYRAALLQAKVSSANQQQQDKGGDATWITGR